MAVHYENVLNPETKKYDMCEDRFQGMVVGKYERNGYDDSDFFAVIYDKETDTIKEVMYDTPLSVKQVQCLYNRYTPVAWDIR